MVSGDGGEPSTDRAARLPRGFPDEWEGAPLGEKAARFKGMAPGERRQRTRRMGRRAAGPYLTSSTCSKSSSTGVARPKIETETLTLDLSKSSSSTTPLKLAKGPSSTLTWSPIS